MKLKLGWGKLFHKNDWAVGITFHTYDITVYLLFRYVYLEWRDV